MSSSSDILQAHSQAVLAKPPRYKPLRSRKAPAVQSAILAKRAMGQSKRQISKDLQLSPNTVTSVIELNDFDKHLTDGRTLCAELIPASVRVVKHRLAQNSENAAFKLLEGIGVLGKDAKPGRSNDPHLTLAIQNLMGNVSVGADTRINTSDSHQRPITATHEIVATGSTSEVAEAQK